MGGQAGRRVGLAERVSGYWMTDSNRKYLGVGVLQGVTWRVERCRQGDQQEGVNEAS